MIAKNYNEWKNCIINDCKIQLTKEYCIERIKVYTNNQNVETLKFIDLYGIQHTENIINWFKQALNE